MISVLSRELSGKTDQKIIQSGVPGMILMENAGRAAAEYLELFYVRRELKKSHRDIRVVVVCGPGKNGGDGFVVARHLYVRGFDVVALVMSLPSQHAETKWAHDALVASGVPLKYDLSPSECELEIRESHLIDALFGIGLKRDLDKNTCDVIAAMNVQAKTIVSLDVPSGLDANTGEGYGATVCADLTLCFGAYKMGLLTPKAADYTGKLVCFDIGVPYTKFLELPHKIWCVQREDVAAKFELRCFHSHKYSAGHLGILGGSKGKTGSLLLCAAGAKMAGAGVVTLGVREEVHTSLEVRVTEEMIHRFDVYTPETHGAFLENLRQFYSKKRVVVVGPGLGFDEYAKYILLDLISVFPGIIVFDADAIRLLADEKKRLGACECILTPHAGELAAFLGMTVDEVERDRYSAVRAAAECTGATVVFKGKYTLVAKAGADQEIRVIPTGNASLATAGSGDVLAGMIGAYACSHSPFEAATIAVYVHGLVGDRFVKKHLHDRGLVASDLAKDIPSAVRSLLRSSKKLPVSKRYRCTGS